MRISLGEPIDFGSMAEPQQDDTAQDQSIVDALSAKPEEPAEEGTVDATPDTTPTDTVVPTTGDSQPTEPAAETTDQIVLDYAKELGFDYTGKYKSDYEYFKSRKELERKLHERDQEAEYGRRVLQTYGDVFTQQQRQVPQTSVPVQTTPFDGVPSREQIQLWQQQVRKNPETGALEAMPGAEANVLQKLQAAQDRMTQAIHALAFQPEQFLQAQLAPVLQQIVQQSQQMTAQEIAVRESRQQQVAEAKAWVDRNASWLCANGKDPSGGFTPAGSRFIETFDSMTLGGLPLSGRVAKGELGIAEAMDIALGRVRNMTLQTTSVQAPRQQAQHVPAVAAMPPAESNELDQRPGESDNEHYVRLMKALLSGQQ